MNLTVTPRASDELKKAIEARRQEQETDTVRVMVQSQCGCGSAHFAMGFDDPEEGDDRLELGEFTLLVDPFSAPFLDNAEMDYSDDLMGQGFRINAANGGGCGCGGGGHGHAHGHQH
jgi:iron-sulfur cluster assembly accessory protein